MAAALTLEEARRRMARKKDWRTQVRKHNSGLAGIASRARHNLTWQAIRDRLEAGERVADVARSLNVSVDTLRHRIYDRTGSHVTYP